MLALKQDAWLQLQTKRVGEVLKLWLPRGGMDVSDIWRKLADIGVGLDFSAEDKVSILRALTKSGIIEDISRKSGGFLGMRNWFRKKKKGDYV